MQRVGKGGQTVSATRFAALTGVSRERLRTWERRYGFPEPHRIDAGPRRYALEDVQRVVAVRRAAEAGVPIPRAIERTRYDEAPSHLASHIFAALVEHAPVAVAALSGPAPLRVEFVNGALRSLPGAPRPGEELTTALPAFYDSPCVLALQQLFATAGAPTEAEHPAWGGDARQTARSTLFRLPSEPDARPLVAMVGLEGEGERVARTALAELQREVEELRRRDERHTRWLDALALLAEEFRREPGRAAVDNGLDVILRHTSALDGAVAFYVSGQLVVPSSRRGLLESSPTTVSAHPELARCLRDGEPALARRRRLRRPRRPARPARLGDADHRRGRGAGTARLRLRRGRAPRRGQRAAAHGGLGRDGLRAAARPPGPGTARGGGRARMTPAKARAPAGAQSGGDFWRAVA